MEGPWGRGVALHAMIGKLHPWLCACFKETASAKDLEAVQPWVCPNLGVLEQGIQKCPSAHLKPSTPISSRLGALFLPMIRHSPSGTQETVTPKSWFRTGSSWTGTMIWDHDCYQASGSEALL
jgi:hypothetical protein